MGKASNVPGRNWTYSDHIREIREAFKEFYSSLGCGCCENREAKKEAEKKLAELLNFKPYSDGSGYNFYEREDDD